MQQCGRAAPIIPRPPSATDRISRSQHHGRIVYGYLNSFGRANRMQRSHSRRYAASGITIIALCAFAVVFARTTMAQNDRRLVDLTHPFDETTIYWPTEEGFKLLRGPAGVTEGGYFYVANRFMCAE